MPHGSAYSAVKSALVTRLTARAGLAGVKVSYQAPVKVEDIQGEFGAYEMVNFDEADGTFDVNVFCGASNMVFDEDYVQTCIVQVLRPESEGTQEVADQRVQEILYEIHAELADQGEWDTADLGLDDFTYIEVTPVSQKWDTGFLPAGAGHGSKCELGLRVQARRSFID